MVDRYEFRTEIRAATKLNRDNEQYTYMLHINPINNPTNVPQTVGVNAQDPDLGTPEL